MSLPLTTSAAEVSSFDALRVVQIAEARIGGPMAASASLAATAAEHGRAIAMHGFSMMLNPETRGPAFTWDRLEGVVLRLNRAYLPSSFPEYARAAHGEELRAASEAAARETVRSLLRDSGVQEWLPLSDTTAE